MRSSLLLVALLGAVSACGSDRPPVMPPASEPIQVPPDVSGPRPPISPPPPLRPPSNEIVRDWNSGVMNRRRLVIRDAEGWSALWAEITRNREPKTDPPAVDFTTHMVVAASMGSRNSGGYSIHIDAVSENAGQLNVVVREVSPGEGCLVTGALTAPLTAVRVVRSDVNVTFIERTQTRDC